MSAAYRIVLTGGQEAPVPVVSGASGSGHLIFNSTTGALSYSMNFSGLDFGPWLGEAPQTVTPLDNVTAAHFHPGATGVAGSPIFDLMSDMDDFTGIINPNGTSTISGNWETTDTPSLTPFLATFSGAGALGSEIPIYINVHTSVHPGGEIRGQLILIATDASETVSGTSGVDFLPGLGGNDLIVAMAGADTLEGGDGADILRGGADADMLRGGTGADKLDGGLGFDRLTGGGGADKFIFNTAPAAINRDNITDYNVAADTIWLEKDVFSGLGALGVLLPGRFHIGANAHDPSDRIIYDSASGKLYFDADGNGAGAKIQFATLDAGLALTAADFVVI